MFTWVGAQFNALLSTYVLGVVSTLMTAIAPIALTTMTLWVALYGWAVLRNEVAETVPTFLWKVFKIGLVLAFALQSGFYISNVADTANALATGVATTFLPTAADPLTIASPYALLDSFNDKASQLVLDLLKVAGLRSASAGRVAGPATAGGAIRAGAGLHHAAGRATGAAAVAGTRFAGTLVTGAGAIVRQGYGVARTAAYRLAALRGRA